MNIVTYIEQVGDKAAAQEFGIAAVTARDWRRQVRRPNADLAIKIAEMKGWTLSQVILPKPADQRRKYTRKQ